MHEGHSSSMEFCLHVCTHNHSKLQCAPILPTHRPYVLRESNQAKISKHAVHVVCITI